jgi:uncharacterized protein (UPF0335 family)
MKIDPVALRTFLDAMHAHADIRDQRTKSIAGIVTDARGKGVDGKALRKVFVRERMDAEKRQRDDELLKAYEDVLGGKGRALQAIAEGVPVGEACAANGVHRATVARARHVAKQASNATPPHDSETGEIIEEITLGANNDGPSDHDSPAEEIIHSVEQGDRQSPLRDGGAPVATSTVGPAVTTLDGLGSNSRGVVCDDLAFPPYLDRRHERVRG